MCPILLLAIALSLKCQSLVVLLPCMNDGQHWLRQQRREGSNRSAARSLAVRAWSCSSRSITAAWGLVRDAEWKPHQLDGKLHFVQTVQVICLHTEAREPWLPRPPP